jgi:lysyl-tRNA synthetase class 1
VHAFQRRGGAEDIVHRDGEEGGRLDQDERAKPLAAAERGMAHRRDQPGRPHRLAGQGVAAEQPVEQQLGNPAWHLLRANGYHGGEGDTLPVTFGLLLNLAGVLGTEATAENLAEYVDNYIGEPAQGEALSALIEAAVAYNRDFVAPTLHKRAPLANEAEALRALDAYLGLVSESTSAEDLQTQVYEIGKDPAYAFESLRDWFRALYETLLGSSQGPRMGSFIALYGIANTRRLIAEALDRDPTGRARRDGADLGRVQGARRE